MKARGRLPGVAAWYPHAEIRLTKIDLRFWRPVMKASAARTALALAVLTYSVAACGGDSTGPGGDIGAFRAPGSPTGWSATVGTSYQQGVIWRVARTGDRAGYLRSIVGTPAASGNLWQQIRADNWRGQRLRFSGWLKVTDAEGVGASLWMRVDGPTRQEYYDSGQNRAINGTGDWQLFSVVLDVPADAVGLVFGVFLTGRGDVIMDDMNLEVVGTDVPTTADPAFARPALTEAAVAAYEPRRLLPMNFGFEF
jgi:hypothetical protein